MIPKVIHYCWFGGNEKPQLVQNCLSSWKMYLPEYEIKEWNESNFDININNYVKEAYESKKWAFVTDYVRLYVLYNYGGVYMDTDVEVFKSLDKFLDHQAFTGFENVGYPVTATIGCVKDNQLIKKLLDYYNDKHFEWLGYGNTKTNTVIMSDILSENGIDRYKNELQETDNITIYPKEIFCPYPTPTENSYTQHHMLGSWGNG